jgi:hypothetical protein
VVGWLWRSKVSEMDALAERLAKRVRQAIDEDREAR